MACRGKATWRNGRLFHATSKLEFSTLPCPVGFGLGHPNRCRLHFGLEILLLPTDVILILISQSSQINKNRPGILSVMEASIPPILTPQNIWGLKDQRNKTVPEVSSDPPQTKHTRLTPEECGPIPTAGNTRLQLPTLHVRMSSIVQRNCPATQ